jgi:hypothetical protein
MKKRFSVKKYAPLIGLLAVALIAMSYLQPDPAVGSCIARVESLKMSFDEYRPRAKSQPQVESAIKQAMGLCREKKFDNASKAMKTASTVCKQNAGCEPKRN